MWRFRRFIDSVLSAESVTDSGNVPRQDAAIPSVADWVEERGNWVDLVLRVLFRLHLVTTSYKRGAGLLGVDAPLLLPKDSQPAFVAGLVSGFPETLQLPQSGPQHKQSCDTPTEWEYIRERFILCVCSNRVHDIQPASVPPQMGHRG